MKELGTKSNKNPTPVIGIQHFLQHYDCVKKCPLVYALGNVGFSMNIIK